MLKIIGGEYRSRRLVEPGTSEISRPYTARVRESLFNLLRGWFDDASVLDLFAGVGTMGLEAVSRGASHVVMVEQDRRTAKRLQENIDALGCGDRAFAVHADALSAVSLARCRTPVDILIVDPPYPMMKSEGDRSRIFRQIEACRSVMGDTGWVILRAPMPAGDEFTLEGFDGPEVHDYGHGMWVMLYAPASEGDDG